MHVQQRPHAVWLSMNKQNILTNPLFCLLMHFRLTPHCLTSHPKKKIHHANKVSVSFRATFKYAPMRTIIPELLSKTHEDPKHQKTPWCACDNQMNKEWAPPPASTVTAQDKWTWITSCFTEFCCSCIMVIYAEAFSFVEYISCSWSS